MNFIKLASLSIRFFTLTGSYIDKDYFHSVLTTTLQSNETRDESVEVTLQNNLLKPQNQLARLLFHHPRVLARMLKKYYMCTDMFLLIIALYMIILNHILIKTTIHLIWVRGDQKKLQLMEDYYYGALSDFGDNQTELNQIFLFSILIYSSVWYFSLFDLLRISLAHAEHKFWFSITQLNFAYFSTFSMGFGSTNANLLRSFAVAIYKIIYHRDDMKETHSYLDVGLTRRLEAELSPSQFKRIILNENLLDFSREFEEISSKAVEFKRKSYFFFRNFDRESVDQLAKNYPYHVQLPLHRATPGSALMGLFLCWYIVSAMAFGLTSFVSLLMANEMQKLGQSIESIHDLHKLLIFLKPTKMIRIVECICIGLGVSGLQLRIYCFLWNSIILMSRINRINIYIVEELERLRKMKKSKQVNLHSREDDDYLLFGMGTIRKVRYENNESNQRVRHLIILIRVIKLEFDDLKERYSIIVNFVIIGNSASLPICLSVLILNKNLLQTLMIALFSLTIILPIFFLLLFAALMERSVSFYLG